MLETLNIQMFVYIDFDPKHLLIIFMPDTSVNFIHKFFYVAVMGCFKHSG